MTRADQTHDMLESIYGDLPEMPRHEPVLRTDTRRVTVGCSGIRCKQGDYPCDGTQCDKPFKHPVPLKQPRIQVNAPRRSAADVAADKRVQRVTWAVKFFGKNGGFWWVLVVAIVGALLSVLPRMAKATELDAERNVQATALADGATTAIAIGTGAGVEANALLSGSPIGIVGITVAKVAVPTLTRGMPPEQRKPVLQVVAAVWGAVTSWNGVGMILVKTGSYAVVWPAAAAVAAGVYMYRKTGRDFDRDTAPITAPEADARLAMAGSPEVMP